MTTTPPIPERQVPWFQPKSGRQYAVFMAILVALMIGSIVFTLKARTPSIPPVIQKARNLLDERKFDEAAALLLPVIQEIEKTGGLEDTRLVKHFDLLAQVYEATNKYADAEPLWRRSLLIRSKNLGPEHPEVIGSGDKVAMCLIAEKKFADAEPLLKKSLAHREKAFGDDDDRIMPSLNRLSELYVAQQKFAEAEPYAQRAVTIGRSKIGLQPPAFADSQRWLGAVLAGLGKPEDAAVLYANAISLKVRTLPDAPHIPPKAGQMSHVDFADLCKEAAAVYRKAGKEKDAKELEAKAEAILKPKQ